MVSKQRHRDIPLENEEILKRYQRRRIGHNLFMTGIVESCKQLFHPSWAALPVLQNQGMPLFQSCPAPKKSRDAPRPGDRFLKRRRDIPLENEAIPKRRRGIPLGDEAILQRYQRHCIGYNLLMTGVVETYKQLFHPSWAPLSMLRNQGMRLFNRVPP